MLVSLQHNMQDKTEVLKPVKKSFNIVENFKFWGATQMATARKNVLRNRMILRMPSTIRFKICLLL
jgi:hypothetical protein